MYTSQLHTDLFRKYRTRLYIYFSKKKNATVFFLHYYVHVYAPSRAEPIDQSQLNN